MSVIASTIVLIALIVSYNCSWASSKKIEELPEDVVNIVIFGDTWISPEFEFFSSPSEKYDDSKTESGNDGSVSETYESSTKSALVGEAISDGPNWIQQVMKVIGQTIKVEVMTFATPNTAIVDGSADVDNFMSKKHKIDALSPLSRQIELYNMHPAKPATQKKTVAIISVGTNDIIYRTEMLSRSPKPWMQYYIYYTSKELCSNVESLLLNGAKNVILIGPGPLAMYPGIIDSNMVHDAVISDTASYILNAKGKKCVEKLMNFYKNTEEHFKTTEFDDYHSSEDSKVFYISLYDFLDDISKKHDSYGISSVNIPCITGKVANPNDYGVTTKVCGNPEEYVFWDDMHFTSKIHMLLADQILQKIKLMFTESEQELMSYAKSSNKRNSKFFQSYHTSKSGKTKIGASSYEFKHRKKTNKFSKANMNVNSSIPANIEGGSYVHKTPLPLVSGNSLTQSKNASATLPSLQNSNPGAESKSEETQTKLSQRPDKPSLTQPDKSTINHQAEGGNMDAQKQDPLRESAEHKGDPSSKQQGLLGNKLSDTDKSIKSANIIEHSGKKDLFQVSESLLVPQKTETQMKDSETSGGNAKVGDLSQYKEGAMIVDESLLDSQMANVIPKNIGPYPQPPEGSYQPENITSPFNPEFNSNYIYQMYYELGINDATASIYT